MTREAAVLDGEEGQDARLDDRGERPKKDGGSRRWRRRLEGGGGRRWRQGRREEEGEESGGGGGIGGGMVLEPEGGVTFRNRRMQEYFEQGNPPLHGCSLSRHLPPSSRLFFYFKENIARKLMGLTLW